jgi:hypothetical protein
MSALSSKPKLPTTVGENKKTKGNKLATANEIILAVMQDVQAVGKNDRNQSQGFNFRGIDAVVNKVGPALRKAGGFIAPSVNRIDYSTAPTKNGGVANIARVDVTYTVYGSDSSTVSGNVVAEAFDSGDKATAKAMSVAYRTFLLQLLCLPTDEPDPDTFSYETAQVIPAATAAALTDWAEVIKSATTELELKNAWDEIAKLNIADLPFNNTTLKALVFDQKALVK